MYFPVLISHLAASSTSCNHSTTLTYSSSVPGQYMTTQNIRGLMRSPLWADEVTTTPPPPTESHDCRLTAVVSVTLSH